MSEYLLETRKLKKYFHIKGKGILHAVDGVDIKLSKGKTLGLVGESGCGKTTVGNLIVGLTPISDGEILFNGQNITKARKKNRKELCRRIQMIFQDPYSSINPKKSIRQILSEPYIVHKIARGEELNKRIREIMEQTGLQADLLSKYPHELDGGKRQAVGIARAIALNPEFIVCDEPVSALDVSIQANIINMLMDIQKERNLTYLFISHDLGVVKHISDDIAVMYLGKIVEYCSSEELFNNPVHPYTIALISAIPSIKIGEKGERIILKGDVPNPINPKPGCRFAGRCWNCMEVCQNIEPEPTEVKQGHFVACHFAKK
jgi:oligopeptide/dipeptide ABC transporter ATP-binding protein